MNDETAVLSAIPDRSRPEPTPPDPRDDSLAAELAKAAPRRWWNRGTVALGAAVLLVGGFVGGLQAQQHWGTADTAGGGNRAPGFSGGLNRAGNGDAGAAFPSAGAGTVRGGAASAAAASGTTGTVKLVNGTTIYIQTQSGDVVTVKTDGKTTVSTATAGKLSDVKAGQSITVRGATGEDGTLTATSVTTDKK